MRLRVRNGKSASRHQRLGPTGSKHLPHRAGLEASPGSRPENRCPHRVFWISIPVEKPGAGNPELAEKRTSAQRPGSRLRGSGFWKFLLTGGKRVLQGTLRAPFPVTDSKDRFGFVACQVYSVVRAVPSAFRHERPLHHPGMESDRRNGLFPNESSSDPRVVRPPRRRSKRPNRTASPILGDFVPLGTVFLPTSGNVLPPGNPFPLAV